MQILVSLVMSSIENGTKTYISNVMRVVLYYFFISHTATDQLKSFFKSVTRIYSDEFKLYTYTFSVRNFLHH